VLASHSPGICFHIYFRPLTRPAFAWILFTRPLIRFVSSLFIYHKPVNSYRSSCIWGSAIPGELWGRYLKVGWLGRFTGICSCFVTRPTHCWECQKSSRRHRECSKMHNRTYLITASPVSVLIVMLPPRVDFGSFIVPTSPFHQNDRTWGGPKDRTDIS